MKRKNFVEHAVQPHVTIIYRFNLFDKFTDNAEVPRVIIIFKNVTTSLAGIDFKIGNIKKVMCK